MQVSRTGLKFPKGPFCSKALTNCHHHKVKFRSDLENHPHQYHLHMCRASRNPPWDNVGGGFCCSLQLTHCSQHTSTELSTQHRFLDEGTKHSSTKATTVISHFAIHIKQMPSLIKAIFMLSSKLR